MMASDSILTGDLSEEIVLRGSFVRKWALFYLLEECKRQGHHCSIPCFYQIPVFPRIEESRVTDRFLARVV